MRMDSLLPTIDRDKKRSGRRLTSFIYTVSCAILYIRVKKQLN